MLDTMLPHKVMSPSPLSEIQADRSTSIEAQNREKPFLESVFLCAKSSGQDHAIHPVYSDGEVLMNIERIVDCGPYQPQFPPF